MRTIPPFVCVPRRKAKEAERAAWLEEQTSKRKEREEKLTEARARDAHKREVAAAQRQQQVEKRREEINSVYYISIIILCLYQAHCRVGLS